MSQDWTAQKERSNPLTLRLICKIAQIMPRPLTRLLLWPITLYFFIFAPKARAASSNYLQRIPGKTGKPFEVFRHLHVFASVVLDRVYFLTDKFSKFNITVRGREELQAALTENRGAILLGAHVGSFEAMRCHGIRLDMLPLKILIYQEHNAMITSILDELNPDVADSVINLADETALLQAKEALEAGYCIGMLGDRVLPDEKNISAMLLGSEVQLPAGPVTLATMLGVPVYMFFGVYTGGNNYLVDVTLLTEGKQLPRNERSEIVVSLIQDYAARIEEVLKSHPYNWFNFYDYWNDKR